MISLSELPWKRETPGLTLQNDEMLVDTFSTHWVKYAGPSIIYVILLITGGGMLYLLADQPQAILAPSALVIISLLSFLNHWFFHRVLGYSLDAVVLTNKRLVMMRANLWINDDNTEHPLVPMRTVEATKKGFIQHILNYGTLTFDVPGGLDLIPQPHHKASVISQILKEFGPKMRTDIPASASR